MTTATTTATSRSRDEGIVSPSLSSFFKDFISVYSIYRLIAIDRKKRDLFFSHFLFYFRTPARYHNAVLCAQTTRGDLYYSTAISLSLSFIIFSIYLYYFLYPSHPYNYIRVKHFIIFVFAL